MWSGKQKENFLVMVIVAKKKIVQIFVENLHINLYFVTWMNVITI